MSQELLVELLLVPRNGQDLSAIARERFQCDLSTLRDVTVASHPAVRWEGPCHPASRAFVLIAVDANQVLVVSAFPLDSARLPDFERLLSHFSFVS